MNETFLLVVKIVVVVAVVLFAYHFWPGLAALLLVGGILCCVAFGVAALGATVVLSLAGAVVLTIASVVAALAVGLAPVWLPILALIGLIALIRGGSRRQLT